VENTTKEMQTRYKKLDTKIRKLANDQTLTPRQVHIFYPRIVNNSILPFSEREMTLLQKGLKYNLHMKHRNWLKNLALEAETAVSHLPTADRDIYRKLIAERITTLHQNSKTPTHTESTTGSQNHQKHAIQAPKQ
jgi:hypothetical protein